MSAKIEKLVKRARRAEDLCSNWNLLDFIARFPQQDLGLHIAVRVLGFAGSQSLATCCKATLTWSSCEGRRLCFCLNDEGRTIKGPFAPLSRLAPSHVELIRLGRYGRASIDDSAEVIATCARASMLRCVFSKLFGIGVALESRLSGSALPHLRRLRFHQCRLSAEDAATLFSLTPQLEQADLCLENLSGLGQSLSVRPCKCPALRTVEFTECGLQTEDVVVFLRMFGESLRTCYLQSNHLRGLRFPSLPSLEYLRLQDCCLERTDAIAIMASCSGLKQLELCGNCFAEDAESEENASDGEGSLASDGSSEVQRRADAWPKMPQLCHADFRACGLPARAAEELRRSLPADAKLELLTATACPSPGADGGRSHIIFDSSDEDN